MKKISLILALVLISVFTFNNSLKVFADTGDLFDESQVIGNAGHSTYSVDLLANSNYELIIPNMAQQGVDLCLVGGSSEFHFDVSDNSENLYYDYFGGPSLYDAFNNGLDVSFTTSDATNITASFEFYDVDISQYVSDGYDIVLLFLGTNGLPDTVPPEYSYSTATVNSPYYSPVTENDIRSQLSATDDEDGDVTANIQVYDDQYTSITPKVIGGNYYIMYVVQDTAGNSAYLKVTVNMIDDRAPYATYDSTTYNNGDSLSLSWFDDSSAATQLTLTEIQSLFTFDDEYYNPGDLTVSTTCSGYDESVPGNYAVDVSVTDPSGNTAHITVNVSVLTNDSPVITGNSSRNVEITDVNINDIIGAYVATDTEDGTLSVVVDGSNSWDYNNPVLGTFTLVLSSTDSLGAKTLKNVTINVVDTIAPVIKIGGTPVSSYDFTVYMSDTSTLQALIDTITASDTYEGDLTSNIVVPSLPSFTVPGTTPMAITVEDSSGNQTTLTLNVTVSDDIVPVINGSTKIVKGKTASLTLSDILATLSATDNVDGTLPLDLVTDGYTGHAQDLGSYLVIYKATDSAGNVTYHDVRIWVVDNVPPVWFVNDYFINLDINQSITRTELVNLMQADGMLGTDISYTVSFLNDGYQGNEETPGQYPITLRVEYDDGSEAQYTVMISVPEEPADGDTIHQDATDTSGQTAWQRTITRVSNWFHSAITWTKGAGTTVWNGLKWAYNHTILPAWNFFFVKEDTSVPGVTVTTATTQISTQTSFTTTTSNVTTTQPPVTTTQPSTTQPPTTTTSPPLTTTEPNTEYTPGSSYIF